MEIRVSTLKGMLRKELAELKSNAVNVVAKACLSDVCLELVVKGYCILNEQLEKAQTYEELDEYVGDAGYRMSLQEWLDSL